MSEGDCPASDVLDVSGTYTVAPEYSISVIYQEGNELSFFNSRWGPKKGILSGHTITAKVLLATLKGEFQDGVITWNTGHVATRTGPAPVNPAEETSKDQGWFPGKELKRGLDKLDMAVHQRQTAKKEGQYEKPQNHLVAQLNMVKRKRTLSTRASDEAQAIGRLEVTVIGGHFSIKRPYLILEMDGSEERTPSAMTSNPKWGTGSLARAEYALPVFDPSSDLRLFLCDDGRVDNEVARGRVIIPIKALCKEGLVPQPKPKFQARYRIMPATAQWSTKLEPRYEEAVPHVSGSGMVRPSQDLGFVDLCLHLELSVPGHKCFGLLAAYCQVEPADSWLAVDDEQADGTPAASGEKVKVTPKVFRGNINRLSRCFRTPYLLQSPQVYALLPLHCIVAFCCEVYHLPWAILMVIIANGVLDHKHCEDRTKDLIFWEECVGEDDMPKGLGALKGVVEGLGALQEKLGKVATLLEKNKNLVNYSDGPVTLVALMCLISLAALVSALFYLVSLRWIYFSCGLLMLLPFLQHAAQSGQKLQGEPGSGSRRALLGKQSPGLLFRLFMMITNVLGRVPDSRDVAHWHFCSKQVIDDEGADRLA